MEEDDMAVTVNSGDWVRGCLGIIEESNHRYLILF